MAYLSPPCLPLCQSKSLDHEKALSAQPGWLQRLRTIDDSIDVHVYGIIMYNIILRNIMMPAVSWQSKTKHGAG